MRSRLSPRVSVILLASAGLGLVVGFIFATRHMQDTSGLTPAGSYLLSVLSLANLLLMTVLLFVLFRELVKGFLEWRRQREGARFRTRLLTAFVLLGLLPSLLLFVGAITLIESSVDRWFSSPVSGLTTAGQQLVDDSLDLVREQTYRKAQALAWQLRQVPEDIRPALAAQLWKAGDIDGMCLLTRSGKVILKEPATFAIPGAYTLNKIFQTGGLKGWIDLTPPPTVLSGVSVQGDLGVAVGTRLPQRMFERARFIAENNQQYLRVRSQRKAMKTSMVSSFLALTLLVTFVAVWVGSRLSREISVPLQLLLEGTEEVSRGNLTHRIGYEARDEIGAVVGSFNRMTRELEVSKSELELSNAELRLTTDSAERGRRYIETLLETLNIGVVSTGPEGEIRTLNTKAREILGVERGQSLRGVVSRPEWAPVQATLASLPHRPVFNQEMTLSTRDGQMILSVSAAPLRDPSGQVFGNLIILEDISALSRAQRIAAWQEAAQRMAHEIKNPLTPIRLSAQRVHKKALEHAPDLQQAAIQGTEAIEREVEAMMTMVNAFSKFARLPDLKARPANLPDLIRETVAAYQTASSEVRFELDLQEPFPPVRMDIEHMGRVFKNLLENALQAMDTRGTVWISLREEGNEAVVKVRDTGHGISPEDRPKLFLPYFSTKKKGTGLGLAIVARILEEHGGEIHIDETVSEGAGFIVTLPLG
jgi:two-component system, NtrC family, nitrogen regulation sensor histidine kinase NtrY